MRVAIIGAGIVGVSTAYELCLLGHDVTVFERRSSIAEEASFANSGVLAPGHDGPWAAPGMGWKVLRHLFSAHTPVRFGGIEALAQLPWMWRWWRSCRPRVYASHRAAMLRLALFSRERQLGLTRELNLEFEQATGVLVLLRSERDLKAARTGLAVLQDLGVAHEVVDAAGCHRLEPGLHTATPLHAAIHLAQDGVGNCRQFAHLLKAQAQRLGARFRFDTTVFKVTAGTAPGVALAGAPDEAFDAVVVCAGVQAQRLLAGVGVRLPLAAVQGYTVTAPLRHVDGLAPPGPRAAVVDERYRIAISRLGQRIRVSGLAEFGGDPGHIAVAPLRTLYRTLDDWFPGAALTRDAQHWKGARPMLPDGPPVLGASGAPGVWLNLGHGASGWALACGSARVLAEQISGRAAPLDVTGLGVARLR